MLGLRQCETRLEEARAEHDRLASELEGYQARFHETTTAIARLEQDLEHTRARDQQLARDLESARRELHDLKQVGEDDGERLARLDERLETLGPSRKRWPSSLPSWKPPLRKPNPLPRRPMLPGKPSASAGRRIAVRPSAPRTACASRSRGSSASRRTRASAASSARNFPTLQHSKPSEARSRNAWPSSRSGWRPARSDARPGRRAAMPPVSGFATPKRHGSSNASGAVPCRASWLPSRP